MSVATKARVVLSGIEGAGFLVRKYEEGGYLPPHGELEFRDYDTARRIALAHTDCGRVELIDEAKVEPPAPRAVVIKSAPEPGLVTKRVAPRRRRTKVPPSVTPEGWSDMADKVFGSVDVKKLTADFFDGYREKVAGFNATGRGKAVAYSQATHDALTSEIFTNRVMLKAITEIAMQLHARIKELEDRPPAPTLRYCGVHVEGASYDPGNLVTWQGSMWHCQEPTTDAPGQGPAWKLAVKKGRDGRDGKP